MFRDNKRVTWRQRRLIRHLSRSKHASVQDAAAHELHRSMRRSHGMFPPKAPKIRSAAMTRVVMTGRRMKGSEMFINRPRPCSS